ncbi:MAG: N-formylglutamate amidohydrolase [Planctomycetes bacterium]|nr:N-formylglutamate amidohydrolase [Planctomycetota bacterium]
MAGAVRRIGWRLGLAVAVAVPARWAATRSRRWVAVPAAVAAAAQASPYSSVTNGRFRGGHITRSYGAHEDGVHAMQLELTQQNYMDQKNLSYDAERAVGLVETIKSMLHAYETSATRGT